MFWTFLNRWSWGLEHKTSHDLTKTSKSVISLLFIPATHSRANLVLLHEDSKVFLFLFKQQPALNSAFPRISDRMCTSKLSSLDCLYLDEICAAYWKRWEKLDCGLWKMCWFLQKTEKCNLSSWLTVRAYFGFHLLRGHHKNHQATKHTNFELRFARCVIILELTTDMNNEAQKTLKEIQRLQRKLKRKYLEKKHFLDLCCFCLRCCLDESKCVSSK